jgi:hypothetical protein
MSAAILFDQPTAAEINGALCDINGGPGDPVAAKLLLERVRNHFLEKNDNGKYILVERRPFLSYEEHRDQVWSLQDTRGLAPGILWHPMDDEEEDYWYD